MSLFLILTTILSSITVFYISAAQATDETYIDTLETENVVIEHELVPMMANGCHQEEWTVPKNLAEQLALEAAMSDPTIGIKLPIELNDPRWPSSEGWYTYQYSGNGFNLHYIYSATTGESADFKFVLD